MKAAQKATTPAPSVRLPELTAQWARAKVMEETGRHEADAKRKEILEAGAEIGYEDESLKIGALSETDLEDKRLEKVLKDERCLEDAMERKISLKKVRALAEFNPRVARVLEQITSKKPRFEQVAKKK